MGTEESIGSILAIDCGTVKTKAVLLDRVGGAYRFVARGEVLTTADAPWYDIAIGAQHAIAQIEEVTGRSFLDQTGHIATPEREGVGIDAVIVLSSAAAPLKVLLAGLVPDMSLASARRAAEGTYSSIVGTISQNPAVGWLSVEDQVRLISDSHPEVVCITGGVDDGATLPILQIIEATALGCSMVSEESRPKVLFAGNKALRKKTVKVLGERTEVRSTDNVRPEPTGENLHALRSELEAIYTSQKLQLLPGGDMLEQWSTLPITPTAKAFSQLIQYIWHLDEFDKGTLGLDIGAVHTSVAAVFDGELHLTIHSDYGTAFSGRRLLEENPKAILRWVPTGIELEQAQAILINKETRPWTVPQEPEELWLEQAVTREVIRKAIKAANAGWQANSVQRYPNLIPMFDPILLTGGAIAGAPRPGQAALIALDAIQPIGISTLLLDRYGLAPMLGGIARLKPLATVETLDSGSIVNLATVVTPVGVAREGDIILRVSIEYEEGGSLEVEVSLGSLEVLPLPPGQEAVLELHPVKRHRFDVGLGGPGKGGRRRVRGGLAGLIIDARGRPLRLPDNPEECQAKVQQWLWDVGG
ncbi:MAG: glutamate mutase L [Anaerolineae bacterium]|nr:glutamate mutase L [Anaerolineae bacterium]